MFQSVSTRVISMLFGALVSLCGHHSRAEPIAAASASDRITSEVLFERGRSLFIEGRFMEACPLLEESQRLAPGIGVLLHLGACFEKLGKTASAWATFQEAADRAGAEGDKERESMARARRATARKTLILDPAATLRRFRRPSVTEQSAQRRSTATRWQHRANIDARVGRASRSRPAYNHYPRSWYAGCHTRHHIG